MISDWIFHDNLRAFLETLGRIVGYAFGPDELTAIHFGVRDSNSETGAWYSYDIEGQSCKCHLEFACDPGTSVVQLRIDLPQCFFEQVAVIVEVFGTYHLANAKTWTQFHA